MAKLDYYFGLCPLIDQRSLLGISEGAEEGYVIVTLGKNIAIKYKVGVLLMNDANSYLFF